MLIIGETVGMWTFSVLCSQFFYKSKTTLDAKVHLKKKGGKSRNRMIQDAGNRGPNTGER